MANKNRHVMPGQIVGNALGAMHKMHVASQQSRQEQAYEFVSSTFVKLLEQDDRIPYEHKRSVIAFWEDLFAHEGVRNNMLLAFSNFLDEIDKRMNASRKAGIQSVIDSINMQYATGGEINPYFDIPYEEVRQIILTLLEAENTEEENLTDIEKLDLSEVGGGHEDNTPLI